MAKSKYEYVRTYERDEVALPTTYLVVRIDGKGFHRFSDQHGFDKPNDRRAIDLMNAAARRVMESPAGMEIVLAFGESDEFSFVFNRSCDLFGRRVSKITTTIGSTFTSFYIRLWPSFFPDEPLTPEEDGPSFDGRLVQYIKREEIIDYLRWRQVDTHINNLYNTTHWCLIQKAGLTPAEAHKRLVGTDSGAKNELLFSYGINYSTLEPIYRKGSLFARIPLKPVEPASQKESKKPKRPKREIKLLHDDIIDDAWWNQPLHRDILDP